VGTTFEPSLAAATSPPSVNDSDGGHADFNLSK